ncbi:hypothetical protein V8B97DRAFT_1914944 [Scleroderma yunnanense]
MEEFVSKLEERVDIKPAKTRLNDHLTLKSILHPLFCKLCGIECDGTKTDCIVALNAVRPLDNKQPFEVSSDGMEIWHPNWLGDVCDNVNAKFINKVADCAFNNEKSLRQMKKGKRQRQRECNHKNEPATPQKDVEVGKDVKMVVGHAWRSIDYVAFLRWLSFCTKHLNCNAPPPKATICKAMVDEGWHQKHPGIQLVEGADWLTGFYSCVNKEELYDADVNYLKELDKYLKSQAWSEENI